MTLRAALTAPAGGDPHARVAGLSVLLRQLLSLQDAGIEEVRVALPAGEIPQDPRLRLRVVASHGGDRGEGSVLSARLGLVTHRSLPQRLVRAGYRGSLEAAPLTPEEFVVAVTDAAARRRAEDLLLVSLIKPTDGLISRAINRRISLRVTRAVIETSLTPNQMTWVAAFFGAAAIAVAAAGGAEWLLAGALLLNVQSILDGCDGEISRLKYVRSRLGEWLDQVLDDLVNVGFFAAAGWAVYRAGVGFMGPVTVLCVALHIAYQAALYLALLTRGGGSGSVTSVQWFGQKDHAAAAETPPSRTLFTVVRDAVETGTRRDFFTFFYLPAILVGRPEIALCWTGLIFGISGVYTVLNWAVSGGPKPATRTS